MEFILILLVAHQDLEQYFIFKKTYTVNIGNIQVNKLPIYAQLASSKITTWNCYRLVPATGLALTSSLTASKNSICAFTGISLLSAAQSGTGAIANSFVDPNYQVFYS